MFGTSEWLWGIAAALKHRKWRAFTPGQNICGRRLEAAQNGERRQFHFARTAAPARRRSEVRRESAVESGRTFAEDSKDWESFGAAVPEVLQAGDCRALALLKKQLKCTIER
jgi:hypothetical protein